MLGIFNLIMSVYLFGITLGSFGINFSVMRLVSEELSIGNSEGVRKIMKNSISISFFCGIIASSIFLIFSDFILENCLHNKVSKNIIYTICFALPVISMSSAISGYFVAVRRVYKSTISGFFEEIGKILITAFFLELFLPKGLEYACFSLIVGDLISEIFSLLCDYILYKYDSKIYKTPYLTYNNTFYYSKKIFKISTPVAITSLIRSGLSTLKQIIIPLSFEKNKLECSNALSIYGEINGMAMPIVLFPNVIFSSISSLFIPEFASYNTQKRKTTIKRLTIIIITISLLLCFLVSIFLFVFSNNLGQLIYKDESISYYIKILSPLAIFVLLDCVVDNILKGLDAQNDVMIINILDTFIDVVLIYTVVPRFGIPRVYFFYLL